MTSEPISHPSALPQPVRIHLTNVVGLGAVQLLKSLLPRLEAQVDFDVTDVYLPGKGDLASHVAVNPLTALHRTKRFLPNALSRVLECTSFGFRYSGRAPLLVMGDIPIRCQTLQTVFVQTPLLTGSAGTGQRAGAIKYWIARKLFKSNIRYVSRFIVQTEAMKISLEQTYPEIAGRVHIVGQPPPEWLLASGLRRDRPMAGIQDGMSLFYPAAHYPHKNHSLLSQFGSSLDPDWKVRRLTLTIAPDAHPNPAQPWIQCVGRLSAQQVLEAYKEADALLFLSQSESLGFPLIEAMWVGLPIVCPDLPYARVLCGDQAIYFDPADAESLRAAIGDLHRRLQDGWWPNWESRLAAIPSNWDEVAHRLLQLAAGEA